MGDKVDERAAQIVATGERIDERLNERADQIMEQGERVIATAKEVADAAPTWLVPCR
jgi:hypothetical protein